MAEVIVGFYCDPQIGMILLIPPATRAEIEAAISRLKIGALIAGFRGRPAGDLPALINIIIAIQTYALDITDCLIEMDVNPVIVRSAGNGAVAVDAFIRVSERDTT